MSETLLRYWNDIFRDEIDNKLKNIVENHNVFISVTGFTDKGDFPKSKNNGVPLLSTNGYFGVIANATDSNSVPVKHNSEFLCIGFQQHFAGISTHILENINKQPTTVNIEVYGDNKLKSNLSFAVKGCVVLKSISMQSGKYEQYTGLLFVNCKSIQDQTIGKGIIVATSDVI